MLLSGCVRVLAYDKKGPYRWLAAVPSLCAVELRLIRLALFVPMVYLVWQWAAKRTKVLVPLGGVVACCLGIGIWSGRRYFATNSSLLHHYGIGRFLWLSGVTHCEDFGQLVFNFPWTKLPSWTAVLIIGTGAIALVLFGMGVIALFKSSPLVSLYLAGCSLLIRHGRTPTPVSSFQLCHLWLWRFGRGSFKP